MWQTSIMAVESCKLWRILGGTFHASLFRWLRYYFQSMLCTGACSALDFRGPHLFVNPHGLERITPPLSDSMFFFWLGYMFFPEICQSPFRDCFVVRASYTFSLVTTLPSSGLLASRRCSSLGAASPSFSVPTQLFQFLDWLNVDWNAASWMFRFWIHK